MFKRIFIVVLLLVMVGCATTKNNSTSSSTSSQLIPPNSKFAKINEGMSNKQVYDLIGMHSDSDVRSSGKQWIPFYFGSDYARIIRYYKGEGRLKFDSDDRVIDIDYDPSEDGYK